MMKKKTKIKLEVGKSYKNRLGGIVMIISLRNTYERTYTGNDNRGYHEDGRFYSNNESAFDLIEEVADIMSITLTTDPQWSYEEKYIATKKSEVSKLEDSLRKHICGLVTMGKYQDAKELLNILIEEEETVKNN